MAHSASVPHSLPNAPPPQRLVLPPATALHVRHSESITHDVALLPLQTEPLSHCSPSGAWTILSPHFSTLHCAEQPSLLALLPSSHCSVPSISPLPHT